MNAPAALVFAGIQHERLSAHLFPGDGLEAAAILMCSRSSAPRVRLLVRYMILVPYEACRIRRADFIAWPGDYIEQALERAESEDLSVVLMHSHPGGLFAFSAADDESDRLVMPSLIANHGRFHGSAIMVPNGAVRARWYDDELRATPIDLVTVAGHNLLYWWEQDAAKAGRIERPLAFTSDMSRELRRLTAGFIGVSGTGSINAEQGCRLGFGRAKLIDFDKVELKNLNRIVNSMLRDARAQRLKVHSFADAVRGYRGEGVAEAIPLSILTREAVIEASQCDVLFCSVDCLEARHIADLIATAFLIPLFDVGVVIPVRHVGGAPAIGDVCGRIDYVQPGRSTLQDRGVYSPEGLRAEYLRRTAPDAHRQELAAGYIRGIIDEAPAVITLNMRAAAACMNEFIARAYPYRHEPNERYARTSFSLAACEEEFTSESAFVSTGDAVLLGRGSLEPLLGLRSWRRHRIVRRHEMAFVVAAPDVPCRPAAAVADHRRRQLAQESAVARCRSRARWGRRLVCWHALPVWMPPNTGTASNSRGEAPLGPGRQRGRSTEPETVGLASNRVSLALLGARRPSGLVRLAPLVEEGQPRSTADSVRHDRRAWN